MCAALSATADDPWIQGFMSAHPPQRGVPPPRAAPNHPLCLSIAPNKRESLGLVLEDMPVRRSRPIRRAWQGRFQSLKVNASLPWRSQLVFELFCLWETDEAVSDFAYRPVKLLLEGKPYAPTAFAIIGDTPWFTEVTWASQITEGKMLQWRRYGEALAAEDFGFQVLTELQIRRQPRLGNALFLTRAIPSGHPADTVVAQAVEALRGGARTIAGFREKTGFSLKAVAQLVLAKVIAVDLEAEIGPTSPIAELAR